MVSKYEVWIADLDPRFGTEPGKTRPVVIVQTDLLEGHHPSTIICPMTTQIVQGATLLRIHLQTGESGMTQSSDILMDQLRAIDNRRFVKKVGILAKQKRQQLDDNLRILLDLQ
ncbi:MAG: type II toxin-antitoxin system PemK/MazF family toxin [Saprospiraceae bacterium]